MEEARRRRSNHKFLSLQLFMPLSDVQSRSYAMLSGCSSARQSMIERSNHDQCSVTTPYSLLHDKSQKRQAQHSNLDTNHSSSGCRAHDTCRNVCASNGIAHAIQAVHCL